MKLKMKMKKMKTNKLVRKNKAKKMGLKETVFFSIVYIVQYRERVQGVQGKTKTIFSETFISVDFWIYPTPPTPNPFHNKITVSFSPIYLFPPSPPYYNHKYITFFFKSRENIQNIENRILMVSKKKTRLKKGLKETVILLRNGKGVGGVG